MPTLEFLPVTDDQRAGYADWLRILVGKSGVYAIADADTEEVLYVGMSGGRRDSDGDLYTTITRHFQRSMVRGGERPAGTYYDRDRAVVTVVLAPPRRVAELERAFIADLSPRDNLRNLPLVYDEDEEEEEEEIIIVEEVPF